MEKFPQNLKENEAIELLGRYGPNELPQSKKESSLLRYSKIIKEPMILLLIAVASIYLFLGDFGEGIMLGGSIFFLVAISLYQEQKAEKALAALRDLSSPRALVIRDGIEKRISTTKLVPGDLISVQEGDRVPADALVIESSHLSIDESLLTGESFPIKDPKNIFSSTMIVSGKAFARITHTGVETEVGKIGKSLEQAEPEELNLSKEIKKIIRLFAWSGSIICALIIIIYGLTHDDWMQAFLIGLATQMTLLPEEFPVILTIFLAMGAWRLSKVNMLIRKPTAIERLGAITVLCVDKTGTLTLNQMSVAQMNNSKDSLNIDLVSEKNLPEDFKEIIEYGVLASHIVPFDPMEKAIHKLLEKHAWGKNYLHSNWELIRGYPLSTNLLAMSCVWKNPENNSLIIASKGAPEAIIDLCHLNVEKSASILMSVQKMAASGLRVLGVARAKFTGDQLHENQHDFKFEWLGLIGLEDPLRPEVPEAVALCRKAGVRVMMMTGDYPETALKIAAQAGLSTHHSFITGKELDTLSDEVLKKRLENAHIFARMIPNQKLRIVKALKEMGHIVAMTGDGVNDAPSLKWADVGIAMGERGTDVAREASDIVLMDDHFSSIVSGIERGRLIFSNIKKAMGYITSIHVAIAGLSILPVIFNWPLILMPIHIVFLELIIDPTCSMLFESQSSEKGTMNKPPRFIGERLFNRKDLVRSFYQGAFILIVSLFLFRLSIAHFKNSDNEARAITFIFLTMSNLGLIFSDMSGGSSDQMKKLISKKSNLFIVSGVFIILLMINFFKDIGIYFKFDHLNLKELTFTISLAVVTFILFFIWNFLVAYNDSDSKNDK